MSAGTLNDYCGLASITLCEYDCELGKTHQGYNSLNYVKHPMSPADVLKMMFAIYAGKEDDLPVINMNL